MATSLAEADAMIEAAEKTGNLLTVFQIKIRFNFFSCISKLE